MGSIIIGGNKQSVRAPPPSPLPTCSLETEPAFPPVFSRHVLKEAYSTVSWGPPQPRRREERQSETPFTVRGQSREGAFPGSHVRVCWWSWCHSTNLLA